MCRKVNAGTVPTQIMGAIISSLFKLDRMCGEKELPQYLLPVCHTERSVWDRRLRTIFGNELATAPCGED